MSFVLYFLVLAGSWFLGVFGWAQIIGGIQNLKTRGKMMMFTIVLWAVILVGASLLVNTFLHSYIVVWIIGVAISLVMVLRQGKIE